MDVIKTIESKKSDYNDLEGFLKENENLEMVSVKDDVIYFLKHRKREFLVSVVGNVNEKYHIKIWRNLIYPSIEIIRNDGEIVHIQATKNKKCVYDFKKLVK
jgi:hypothetical protein